jgi:isoleucyl-tRNA synthetase
MSWPQTPDADVDILEEMRVTRHVVSLALEARAKANIKIRQPLQTLWVKHAVHPEAEPYLALIRDEVNVKEIVSDMTIMDEVGLDTKITPELKAEGDAREFMRQVQDMRKKMGLEPKDRIMLAVRTSEGGEAVLKTFEDVIKKVTGADTLSFDCTSGEEIIVGEHSFTVSISKV